MKIFILGPVMTEHYIGGVASFHEGLAVGFYQNGWQTFLLTDQKETAGGTEERNGISVIYIRNRRSFRKLAEREKPDVIITCLAYAKYLAKGIRAKKIYVLHAFFNRSYYGLLKSVLAVPYQKWLIRKCDLVFANSYFTQMINSNFYNIRTDQVFYPGVSDTYWESCKKIQKTEEKEIHTILFAGRLVPCKRVDMLLRALALLSEQGVEYRAYIVGGGPQMSRLSDMAGAYGIPVVFPGVMDQAQLAKYYWRSEVFVSLDDREPFGIVFLEALLAQCKIVCPYTGGQAEYLHTYGESVAYVDCNSPKSIMEGIKHMFEYGIAPHMNQAQRQACTYKMISARMIDYISSLSIRKPLREGDTFWKKDMTVYGVKNEKEMS